LGISLGVLRRLAANQADFQMNRILSGFRASCRQAAIRAGLFKKLKNFKPYGSSSYPDARRPG